MGHRELVDLDALQGEGETREKRAARRRDTKLEVALPLRGEAAYPLTSVQSLLDPFPHFRGQCLNHLCDLLGRKYLRELLGGELLKTPLYSGLQKLVQTHLRQLVVLHRHRSAALAKLFDLVLQESVHLPRFLIQRQAPLGSVRNARENM